MADRADRLQARALLSGSRAATQGQERLKTSPGFHGILLSLVIAENGPG